MYTYSVIRTAFIARFSCETINGISVSRKKFSIIKLIYILLSSANLITSIIKLLKTKPK